MLVKRLETVRCVRSACLGSWYFEALIVSLGGNTGGDSDDRSISSPTRTLTGGDVQQEGIHQEDVSKNLQRSQLGSFRGLGTLSHRVAEEELVDAQTPALLGVQSEALFFTCKWVNA